MKKIAFETRGHPNKIMVMNVDGTDKILLSTPESDAASPEWTPDATKIVYRVYENETGLWIVDASGNKRKRLCNITGNHHVSPIDGKIVFGNYEGIFTVNPDGSGLTHLINLSCSTYPILWSPDGGKIAFRADANRDGKESICIVNDNGAGLEEIIDSRLEVTSSPWRAFDWVH